MIRRLVPADAAIYRAVRLEGLVAHPDSFVSSAEEEAALPLNDFEERLRSRATFGGWTDGPDLAGIAHLVIPAPAKMRHKAVLGGVYVRLAARGTGLSRALLDAVIDHAREVVEGVNLFVNSANDPAIALYEGAGFRRFGLERRAVKIGDAYHDELLMELDLR